jgi:hypothetical protein
VIKNRPDRNRRKWDTRKAVYSSRPDLTAYRKRRTSSGGGRKMKQEVVRTDWSVEHNQVSSGDHHNELRTLKNPTLVQNNFKPWTTTNEELHLNVPDGNDRLLFVHSSLFDPAIV